MYVELFDGNGVRTSSSATAVRGSGATGVTAQANCVGTRRMRLTTRGDLMARLADATGLRTLILVLWTLTRCTGGDSCAICITPPPMMAPPHAQAQSFASANLTDIIPNPVSSERPLSVPLI